MDGLIKIFVIARLILYVSNDFLGPDTPEDNSAVPDKCRAMTHLLYRQCCVFPPFFVREVARECGALLKLNFIDQQNKVAGMTRKAITGCKHWQCVLEKYFLLSPDGNVDEEKYFLHLDKWVDLNPMFANVMLNAKIHCKMFYKIMMPLSPCEFSDFQACIRNFIVVNCPIVLQTPSCLELKSFYEDCKEYYQ